jgi:steroid 5-alpha reductase family enzyme
MLLGIWDLYSWPGHFILSGDSGARGILVNIFVSIWGLRLACHIHSRNKGKTEDYRYLAWREEWGKWFYARSYSQIYLLQGFLLFLIVLPVFTINKSLGSSLGWLDFMGVAVWLFGFYFEADGDLQLAQFIKSPANKGKLIQSGLLAYTRHPNYFGEVTLRSQRAFNGADIEYIGCVKTKICVVNKPSVQMFNEKPRF